VLQIVSDTFFVFFSLGISSFFPTDQENESASIFDSCSFNPLCAHCMCLKYIFKIPTTTTTNNNQQQQPTTTTNNNNQQQQPTTTTTKRRKQKERERRDKHYGQKWDLDGVIGIPRICGLWQVMDGTKLHLELLAQYCTLFNLIFFYSTFIRLPQKQI
jgi:hypothetical protein